MNMEDTIAAIATAYGEGGIGIVRISGPASQNIISEIFTGKISDHELCYGRIHDNDNVIDEVLAVFMKGPRSYTAEDVVEINCHGSMVSLRRILALVLRKGARLAEPGEFTKRAFLNGRLDLSQAEAVIDLIKAKSDTGFDMAVSQLQGNLSKEISSIRKEILDVLVDVTVNIDYPDEDIELLTYEKLNYCLCHSLAKVEKLIESSASGRMVKEGIRVAIVGKPNVGKSSLMNCLLRQSRAIVTEIPGTTRDTIEEALVIRGIPVYLIDTAGIRHTDDKVELIGIGKSMEAFSSADFVIFVIDGSTELTDEDYEIINKFQGRKCLVLINKRDLGAAVSVELVSKRLPESHIVEASVSDGSGIRDIEDYIENLVFNGGLVQKDSLMVSNVRHMELLNKSRDSINDAINLVNMAEPLDIVEIDIRNAFDFLGEIVGETVSDEIIDEVFSRFCLGK